VPQRDERPPPQWKTIGIFSKQAQTMWWSEPGTTNAASAFYRMLAPWSFTLCFHTWTAFPTSAANATRPVIGCLAEPHHLPESTSLTP
jgi:hypothetical protein